MIAVEKQIGPDLDEISGEVEVVKVTEEEKEDHEYFGTQIVPPSPLLKEGKKLNSDGPLLHAETELLMV